MGRWLEMAGNIEIIMCKAGLKNADLFSFLSRVGGFLLASSAGGSC